MKTSVSSGGAQCCELSFEEQNTRIIFNPPPSPSHKNVDASEALHRLPNELLAILLVRKVSADRNGLCGAECECLSRHLLELLQGAGGKDDAGPSPCVVEDDCAT